jgi:arsenate reductase
LLDWFEFRGHLAAISAIAQLEADFLVVRKACEARAFDGGNMDENILAAAIRRDKAKTFGGVKPFHGAGGHDPRLLLRLFQTPRIVGAHVTGSWPGVFVGSRGEKTKLRSRGLHGFCKNQATRREESGNERKTGGDEMRIYGLKACDTCRKALKLLPGAQLVDLRETPLAEVLLERALAQFSGDLVNQRSTTWRGLSEVERAMAPAALLRAHPALMKRPLIETEDGTLYLGWTPAVQAALVER